MLKLKIILGSSRQGRKGHAVAAWITEAAKAHGAFDVELLDLREVDLPMLDEPNHPRMRQYVHDHTKAWSAKIDAADAYIFVMPEYNYGYSAVLKNAIDHLFQEWQYKPLGAVCYGGVSGGLRGLQSLKPTLTAIQLTIAGEVPIPFFQNFIGDDDVFRPNTWHSIELNALVPVKEWGDQPVRFALEEDAAILADGRWDWILKRQSALYLIK